MSEEKKYSKKHTFLSNMYLDDNDDIIKQALIGIQSKFPIISAFVEDVNIIEKDVETAETDGENVYYNRKFMESLTSAQRQFVFAHEFLHIHFNHIKRGKNKNPSYWNIATDAVINAKLKAEGMEMPEGLVDLNIGKTMSAEEIYGLLVDKKVEIPQISIKNHSHWKQFNKNNNSQNGSGEQDQDSNEQSQTKDKKQESQNNPSKDNSNDEGESLNKQSSIENNKHSKDDGKGNDSSNFDKNSQNQDGNKNNESDEKGNYKNNTKKDKDDSKDGGDSSKDCEKDDSKQQNSQDKNKTSPDNQQYSHDDDYYSMQEKTFCQMNDYMKKSIAKQFKSELEKRSQTISDAWGRGKGNLKEQYGDVGEPEKAISWKRLLRKEIEKEEDKWTYRRASEENYFQAGISSLDTDEKPMTEILIDTSGSVSSSLVKEFLRQLKPLLKESEIKVACFDEDVYEFVNIKRNEDINNFIIQGGGGTDFNEAVTHFSKDKRVNKIVFTDGYCDFTLNDPAYKNIIWVVYDNKDFTPSLGKVINVEQSQILNKSNNNAKDDEIYY